MSKVIESLSKEDLSVLTEWDELPLYLMKSANNRSDDSKYNSVSFSHVIVPRWKEWGEPFAVNSNLYYKVHEILSIFCESQGIKKPSNIFRCALNVTVPIDGEYIADAHVDHPFPHHLVLIYLNDSDGNTVLYQEEYQVGSYTKNIENMCAVREVSPSKGKILYVEEGLTYHTARPCTEGYRAVLVITFN